MFKHKSGSQKRKERNEREQKFIHSQKGQKTLASFQLSKKTSESEHSGNSLEAVESDDTPSSSVKGIINDHSTNNSELLLETVISEQNEAVEIPQTPAINGSKSSQSGMYFDTDIGCYNNKFLPTHVVEYIIQRGHLKLPETFPRDKLQQPFPSSILFKTLPNGEKVKRDWLVWSNVKSAFFCFPCRLFNTNLSSTHFSSSSGYSKQLVWKKLYDRIPSHEKAGSHIQSYLKWRECEFRICNQLTVSGLILEEIATETRKWTSILTRILDVILFLSERGLALTGESHLIGNTNNGNFLGILEIISHYDPVLRDHLQNVKEAQLSKKRLQVHYLSNRIQNEFIELCAQHVITCMLNERKLAKYYSLILDSTPDSSHFEQTTFILRYLVFDSALRKYFIKERFLKFVECSDKKGEAIFNLICQTLEGFSIPIEDCRGQGYDNASNMKGEKKGVQARILSINPLAVYSPCATHSLNLVGVDSAECCSKAITFFAMVQKTYNIFSSSPQRWEILKNTVVSSLHSQSDTRWSARIEAIKPFAKNLPFFKTALENLLDLNLTIECRSDIHTILKYLTKFECVLMSSIWFKILSALNERNVILQAVNATLDVEVLNLNSLLDDLNILRKSWKLILNECKVVAQAISGVEAEFPVSNKRNRINFDKQSNGETYEEFDFRVNTYFIILDSVIAGINIRYKAVNSIHDTFSFLWHFKKMENQNLSVLANNFAGKYQKDVSSEIADETMHLKNVYESNFDADLLPLDLLNAIAFKNLESIFPNICIALRIFCSLPVSVASAERSFSVLTRIKNFSRSCSSQARLSAIAILAIESEVARKLDFGAVIKVFAAEKARKATLSVQ